MANVYRYKKPPFPVAAYAVDQDVTHPWHAIEMGDLVQWDEQNRNYVKPLNAGMELWFVGVAEGVSPTPTSNIDNVPGLINKVLVRESGVFSFATTAGETYHHGDALQRGANPQTVSNVAVTEADTLGFVWRPEATAVLVGAAGQDVDVAITQRWPGTAYDPIIR